MMEREYMSQTEMMRTLEALVATVEGLKYSVTWRLPLLMGAIFAASLAVFGAMAAFIFR